MSVKTKQVKTKEDLINDLFWLSKQLEEVWQYHPNNPNKVDVELEYNEIKAEMSQIESQINN